MNSISKKEKILSILIPGAVLVILSVLQNSNAHFPTLFSANAFLLIPATVCLGMSKKPHEAFFFGLFSGSLWDVFTNGSNLNALYLALIAFGCSVLINVLMRNNIVTAFILTAIATLIYCLGRWIFNFVIPGLDGSLYILFRYYLLSFLYTCFLSPFIFYIIKGSCKYNYAP